MWWTQTTHSSHSLYGGPTRRAEAGRGKEESRRELNSSSRAKKGRMRRLLGVPAEAVEPLSRSQQNKNFVCQSPALHSSARIKQGIDDGLRMQGYPRRSRRTKVLGRGRIIPGMDWKLCENRNKIKEAAGSLSCG